MTQYASPYTSSTTRQAGNDGGGGLLSPPPGERPDDRGQSLSGSDDGGSITQKTETEIEGPSHLHHYPSPRPPAYLAPTHAEDVALTSQTLNADGTPKRPMNAFMIFARRRRPQVSAENQSMRTGEISKLLSKEWTTMPMSEKQFYLDQAKILKENFNSKYPDYVYRRRPNNTRKKNRRGDIGGLRQLDGPQLDDMAGHDLGESSHTDEEILDANGHYSRVSHDVPQTYENHGRYNSASSRYSIPSDNFRPTSSHDNRIPYPAPSDRLPQEITTSRLSQGNHNSYNYSYPSSTSGSSSLYEPLNSSESWQQHKIDRGCTWPNSGSHDRMLSSIGTSKVDSYAPSSTSHGSWQPPSASTNGSSSSSNSYQFQALTTPFTPHQNVTGYSSSPSPAPANHYESSSHGSREYDHRPFAPSPSISPSSYPHGRDTLPYPQRQSSISRTVTSVPGISSFNHPGMQHSEASSSHGYWARE